MKLRNFFCILPTEIKGRFYSKRVLRNFNIILPIKKVHLNFEKNYSRYCANTIMSDGGKFSFNDYDIIGFDLDNTLVLYNLPEIIKLEYEALSKYLVKYKNYPDEILKPIDDDIDFLQRGLILDSKRGNLLKISNDGTILKATHGTRLLNDNEIKQIYGEDKSWDMILKFIVDPLSTWNGPASDEIRAFLDYFDVPSTLLIARAVDAIDKHQLNKGECSYKIWGDILDGLFYNYRRESFAEGTSDFFEAIKKSPEKYVLKVNPKIIDWIKELKKTKAVYLLTGSNIDFANLIATYAIGENWRDLFDVVVTYAKKPGFFTQLREFYEVNGTQESTEIHGDHLKLNNVYSQGNWKYLEKLLKQKINTKHPRSLYIGDNLIQDIYTSSKYTDCDTISITSEILEGTSFDDHTKIISSKFWDSFFNINNNTTIWTDIILNYSKLCIPSLDCLAENSIHHNYDCFKANFALNGFYPIKPFILNKKENEP